MTRRDALGLTWGARGTLTSQLMATDDEQTTSDAGGAGAFVFVVTVLLGVGAGFLIGAKDDGGSSFHWLIFAVFVAAAIVSASAVWCGVKVAGAVRR